MESERPYNHEEDWNWEQVQNQRNSEENSDQTQLFSEDKENNLKEFFKIVNSAYTIEDMERICKILDGEKRE